jgi:hypothetical protein
MVVEGQARGVPPARAVTVLRAGYDGDAVIAVAAARAVDDRPQDHVVVVTADRELRSRVEAGGARVVGPRAVLPLL